MYKGASAKAQRAHDRRTDFSAMALPGADVLPARDRLAYLQARLHTLEPELLAARGERRKELGLIKHRISEEVRALKLVMRPEKRKARPMSVHFVLIAQQHLSGPMFDLFKAKALQAAQAESIEINAAPVDDFPALEEAEE